MKEKIIVWIIAIFCFLSLVAGFWIILREKPMAGILGISISSISGITKGPGVAVVYIYGPLTVTYRSKFGTVLKTGTDRIVDQLEKVRKNPDIKAVILRIDSPGGTVAAVQEVWRQVQKLKKEGKKVVASFADLAASGAYYVAAPVDKIFANPGTITGSIGVVTGFGNFEGLLKKIGVKMETIKSGRYKDMGSPYRTITKDERRLLEGIVNDAHNQFMDAVVKGRKLKGKQIKEISEGQIFTGAKAKSLGLVDELGGLKEAIKCAGKLAGIKGEPKVIDLQPYWEKILGVLDIFGSSKSHLGIEQIFKSHLPFQVAYIWGI